jgi:hypothetical protein
MRLFVYIIAKQANHIPNSRLFRLPLHVTKKNDGKEKRNRAKFCGKRLYFQCTTVLKRRVRKGEMKQSLAVKGFAFNTLRL